MKGLDKMCDAVRKRDVGSGGRMYQVSQTSGPSGTLRFMDTKRLDKNFIVSIS